MSALTGLPTKTPEERYVASAPGPVPAVCSIVMFAFGFDHEGCVVTSSRWEKTRSGGASISILNFSPDM
jgi:hypothetical protein